MGLMGQSTSSSEDWLAWQKAHFEKCTVFVVEGQLIAMEHKLSTPERGTSETLFLQPNPQSMVALVIGRIPQKHLSHEAGEMWVQGYVQGFTRGLQKGKQEIREQIADTLGLGL